MRLFRQGLTHMALLLMLVSIALAQTPPPEVEAPPMMTKPMGNIEDFVDHDARQCSPDGIAVGGFDVLSYRTPGGPVAGTPNYVVEYEGLKYRFVTAKNASQFESDPVAYVPRYRGWCAVTLALGRLTCPDFTSFKVENGELLLFEVTGFTSGRSLWDTDAEGYRAKADSNFLQLIPAP